MRAPASDATGSSGETEVAAEFQRLGWGVHQVGGRQDTGTDLLLAARDRRRVELRRMLGAQVKAGPAFFQRPRRGTNKEVDGWWYREKDREHFEYWANHQLAHLLVLRNQVERRSYWVHITDDAVIPTGKGAKIFVPRANVVDDAHQEELIALAVKERDLSSWEGSVWTTAALAESDRIRHALITPRVVAPHQNIGAKQLDGIEALAAQVSLLPKFEHALTTKPTRKQDAPATGWISKSIEEAAESSDWSWRAMAGLRAWSLESDGSGIEALTEVATSTPEQAATAVLRAVACLEDGRPEDALAVIDEEIARDSAGPADHAWLLAHKAWYNLELGALDDAVDAAAEVLATQAHVPNDITLAALASAAARTIFDASGWGMRPEEPGEESKEDEEPEARTSVGVKDLITRSDTHVSWWRNQLLAWSLAPVIEAQFRDWSKDPSIRIGGSDAALRYLYAAALQSAFAADRSARSNADAMTAQHLLTDADPDVPATQVASYLSTLRGAGAHKETRLAVRQLSRNGPLEAVRIAAAVVNLARSTFTSAQADLALLTAAADLLEPEQAERLLRWALATHENPDAFRQRTTARFGLEGAVLDLMASLVPVATPELVREVVDYVKTCLPSAADFDENHWLRLVQAIPDETWTPPDHAWVIEVLDALPSRVARRLQQRVPSSNSDVDEATLAELRSGSTVALAAVPDISKLPSDAAASAIQALAIQVERLRTQARAGVFPMGKPNALYDLTLVNLWHPEAAAWPTVINALRDSALGTDKLVDTVQLIAEMNENVPPDVTDALAAAIAPLQGKPASRYFHDDVRGAASEALAVLGRPVDLATLISGSPRQRASAVRIVRRTGQVDKAEMVLLLANDDDPAVASTAAYTLANWAATGLGGPEITSAVINLAEGAGTAMLWPIAEALGGVHDLSEPLASFRDKLRQHPSQVVRRALARTAAADPA